MKLEIKNVFIYEYITDKMLYLIVHQLLYSYL